MTTGPQSGPWDVSDLLLAYCTVASSLAFKAQHLSAFALAAPPPPTRYPHNPLYHLLLGFIKHHFLHQASSLTTLLTDPFLSSPSPTFCFSFLPGAYLHLTCGIFYFFGFFIVNVITQERKLNRSQGFLWCYSPLCMELYLVPNRHLIDTWLNGWSPLSGIFTAITIKPTTWSILKAHCIPFIKKCDLFLTVWSMKSM